MVCFADCTPQAIACKESDNMIKIMFVGTKVEDQRSLAVVPEYGSSKHSTFHALGRVFCKGAKRGFAGVAVCFKVKWDGIEKILYFCRGIELFE